MADLATRIRQYITDEFVEDADIEITDEMLLIEEGIIDSLGIFVLVGFLEAEFGIDIEETDMDVANFESLQAMVELVSAKGGS